MKRKCEEDTNVLLAILSHDDVFVVNIVKLMLLKKTLVGLHCLNGDKPHGIHGRETTKYNTTYLWEIGRVPLCHHLTTFIIVTTSFP